MAKRSKFFQYDPKADKVVEVTDRATLTHLPRYPIASDSMAVHPSQIDEVRQFDRSNGVPTDYTPDGRPLMTDAMHYRRYKRLHGFHDRRGFFR